MSHYTDQNPISEQAWMESVLNQMSRKPSKQHRNFEELSETVDVDWDSIIKANPILKDKNLKNKMKAWETLSSEGEKHGLKPHSADLAKFIADGMKKLGLA